MKACTKVFVIKPFSRKNFKPNIYNYNFTHVNFWLDQNFLLTTINTRFNLSHIVVNTDTIAFHLFNSCIK